MSEELIYFKKWNGENIKRPMFQYDKKDKPLVKFLNKQAKECCEGRVSTVKTIYNSKEELIGYYAIAMSHIESSKLFDEKKVSTFPHPAIKLGRILLDSNYRGKKYGTAVLMHIIQTAQQLNDKFVACRFIIVDSKPKVVRFYQRNGFIEVKENKRGKLRRLIKTLSFPVKKVISHNETIPMLFDLKL